MSTVDSKRPLRKGRICSHSEDAEEGKGGSKTKANRDVMDVYSS